MTLRSHSSLCVRVCAHAVVGHWLRESGLLLLMWLSCLYALFMAILSHTVTAWLDLHTKTCVLPILPSSHSLFLSPISIPLCLDGDPVQEQPGQADGNPHV